MVKAPTVMLFCVFSFFHRLDALRSAHVHAWLHGWTYLPFLHSVCVYYSHHIIYSLQCALNQLPLLNWAIRRSASSIVNCVSFLPFTSFTLFHFHILPFHTHIYTPSKHGFTQAYSLLFLFIFLPLTTTTTTISYPYQPRPPQMLLRLHIRLHLPRTLLLLFFFLLRRW